LDLVRVGTDVRTLLPELIRARTLSSGFSDLSEA
jgi:hypothetical protein